METALREGDERLLDLQEAARESSYSPDHVGRVLRESDACVMMTNSIYVICDLLPEGPVPRSPHDVLPLKPKPFLLLLVLEKEGPLHGYAIKKAMHEQSDGTVAMDPGGLYRLIGRLERDGLVRRVERPSNDHDERRQYLAITDWGRAVVVAEAGRISLLARLPSVQALAREAR